MRGLLLALNLSWSLLLVVATALLVLDPPPKTSDAPTPTTTVAPAVVEAPPLPTADCQAQWIEANRAVRIDFPAAMVGPEAIGSRLAPELLQIRPELPVLAEWRAPDRLLVTPLEAPRPATAYRIGFAPALRALDGRRLDPELSLNMETPRPRLVQVQIDDERALLLHFDQTLAQDALERHLTITTLAGEALPVALTCLDPLAAMARDAAAAGRVFRCLPVGDHPSVRLRIAAGLVPQEGELGTTEVIEREVRLQLPLAVASTEASTSRLTLRCSHALPSPAADTWRLDPPLPVTLEARHGRILFHGDFPPGELVRLRLEAGFPGSGRARLEAPYEVAIRIPDRPPRLRVTDRGSVLSSRATAEIGIAAINLPACELRLRRVYANNLVHAVHRGARLGDELLSPPAIRRLGLAAERNREERLRVDLAPLLDELPGEGRAGLYQVQLRDPAGRCWVRPSLLQITDLGISARASGDRVAVRVASIADGQAIRGARIRVLGPTNQELCRGESDQLGLALLRFTPRQADHRPYLIVAEHGGDRSFVALERHGVALTGDHLAGRPQAGDEPEAWLHFERGIVRPGSELRAVALLRRGDGAAGDGRGVESRWIDPDGRCASTAPVTTDAAGIAVLRHALSADARSGMWRLELRRRDPEAAAGEATTPALLGVATVQVEAFVPARLEAELAIAPDLVCGGSATITVTGRWLSGEPAAERKLVLRPRLERWHARVEGFDQHRFGTVEANDQPPPGALPPIEAVLDAQGRAVLRLPLPATIPSGWQGLRLECRVELEDPSGRSVRASAQAVVRHAEGQLGIQAQRSADGSQAIADCVLLAPAAAAAELELVLEHRRWRWGWHGAEGGGWRSTLLSRVVASRRVAATGERQRIALPLPATPAEHGWYALRARLVGGSLETDDALDASPPPPDRLRLEASDAAVVPGTSATLRCVSPIAGSALLTVEGAGIVHAAVHTIPAGTSVLAVPIPADCREPSLHVTCLVAAPQRDALDGAPLWIAGAARIVIDHPERRLAVTLDAPTSLRPGEALELTIDAPGASSAVVLAVDAGIIGVTDHPVPDPAGWFLAPRRLAGRGASTLTALLDSARYPQAPGGDTAVDALRRRIPDDIARIREVALLRGPLGLDSEGRARLRLELPPYEGRLRLAVIAAGPEGTGAAWRELTVAAPLGCLLAGPRMLQPGDRSQAVLSLRNRQDWDGRVHLELDGGEWLALDPVEHEFPLAAGAQHHLVLPLRALAAGDGLLRVRAELRGAGDRRVASETTLPLRVARPAVFTTWQQVVALDGEHELALPPATGPQRLRVVVGTRPDLHLLAAAEHLIAYPHGCLEQTASRCAALLAAGELLDHDRPEAARRARDLLRLGIARIAAMRSGGGDGLALWPGGGTDRFATLYALDVLLDCRAAGVELPTDLVERLLDQSEAWLDLRDGGDHVPYALSVLARGRREVVPWLQVLAARRAQPAHGEEAALRALAWAAAGEAQRAREELTAAESLPLPGREEAAMLRSPLRARASLLRAWLAVDPGAARVHHLAADLAASVARPGTRSTQELGQALRALAAYYARNAAALTGRQVGIALAADDTGDDAPDLGPIPTQALELEAAADSRLRLRSDGPLVVVVSGEGWLSSPPDTTEPALELRREVIDLATAAPAERLVQGRLYEVRLHVVAGEGRNVLVVDPLPGGCEPEPGGDGAARRADHVDQRDDRVLLHCRTLAAGAVLAYRLRAVTPGSYHRLPTRCELLYRPGASWQASAGGPVEILP